MHIDKVALIDQMYIFSSCDAKLTENIVVKVMMGKKAAPKHKKQFKTDWLSNTVDDREVN